MMYKTGKLDVSSDVRSKPLEKKRKRGRPAQLPLCLSRSPPNKDKSPERNLALVNFPEVGEILSPEKQVEEDDTVQVLQIVAIPEENETSSLESLPPAKRKGHYKGPMTRKKRRVEETEPSRSYNMRQRN